MHSEGEGEVDGEFYEKWRKSATLPESNNYHFSAHAGSCWKGITKHTIGRPQVWVRLRPSPRCDDNVFRVSDDEKILKALTNSEEVERLTQDDDVSIVNKIRSQSLAFRVDGILRNSSQEEAYDAILEEVVIKAMDGTSGTVLLMGPEVSGKSFTLVGYPKRYEHRGLIPRALERIFEIVESRRKHVEYKIQLAVVDIHQNRIKDLLTMGTSEILRIGKDGPHGMYSQEISSSEEGVSLLMLALFGQRGIPRQSFAKYHTFVYVDIHGETDEGSQSFDSRITFCKIASMPKRINLSRQKPCVTADYSRIEQIRLRDTNACTTHSTIKSRSNPFGSARPATAAYQSPKSCCLIKNGPVGETIHVRRDLFLLEQIFKRSTELRRLEKFHAKVKRAGMLMLMKPPNPTPSQYFRQCKLAHCLQDIVAGTTEVRLILTLRPEREYLQISLEALRFAGKVKCASIPHPPRKSRWFDLTEEERQQEQLQDVLREMHKEQYAGEGTGISFCEPNKWRMDRGWRQRIYEAQDFLHHRIPEIKIVNKQQVKAMFETIRQIWTFAAEHDWNQHQKLKQLEEGVGHDSNVGTDVAANPTSQPETTVESTPNASAEVTARRKKSQSRVSQGRKPSRERKKRTSKADNVSQDGQPSRPPILSVHVIDIAHNGKRDEKREDSQCQPDDSFKIQPAHRTSLDKPDHALHDPMDAWKEFVHTTQGEACVKQISKQSSAHAECVEEVNGILGPVCNVVAECLHMVSSLLLRDVHLKEGREHSGNRGSFELSANKAEEHAIATGTMAIPDGTELEEGPMDELKAVDANCDEFFHKMLELCRSALEQHEQIINHSKAECEKLFVQFAKDKMNESIHNAEYEEEEESLPPSEQPHGESEAQESAPEHNHHEAHQAHQAQLQLHKAQNYQEIIHNAKLMAKQLLKCYSGRPSWVGVFSGPT